MRIRKRLAKALFWLGFFLATSLVGVVGFAYWYVTDSETLAGMIRAESARYLPGSRVEPGRARVRMLLGEFKLTQSHVWQVIDGTPFLTLRVAWLQLRYDPWAMLKRKFVPRELVIAQPRIRLLRRRDGTWNLQGLLASPWPAPPMKVTPPVRIENGTVVLVEGTSRKEVALLRDVTIRIDPGGDGLLKFEGSAQGDAFDRVRLQGDIDVARGRITLGGDLARLSITDTLLERIPAELHPHATRLGLTRGEVDIRVRQVSYDPAASPALHYDVGAQVRSGVWRCPKLPFELNDLAASLSARDGVLTIDRVEGFNGPTVIRAAGGRLVFGDPARTPLDLRLDVIDLELDRRLRDWTPPEFRDLWRDFSPRGRISAAIRLVRDREGGPLGYAYTVDCRDVALLFRHFPYPVEHVRGILRCEKQRIQLDLQTMLGGKPLRARGTIDNPGPDAHSILDFEGESLPIDATLLNAIPPDIRKVVKEYQPTGTVRGRARVERTRRTRPSDPPEGIVTVDAYLDLNENCAMKWIGLPYPIGNLTGQLELHPTRWIFRKMHGSNGQAVITGSGSVEKVPGPGEQFAVDLRLNAENIPFNDQLRTALPPAWQVSWKTLNPVGASDVDADIHVRPGRPDQYRLVVDPRDETLVRLEFSRAPRPGIDPGGTFDLRMENVKGRFIYNNGPVEMKDVSFQFHGSPVQFASGRVQVENNGRFRLGVAQVWARNFRIDSELRKIMPPVMAQFAHRFDEGRPLATIKGNLGLSWDGPGRPVHCDWNDALVVLNDNTIQAGLPLEHLQGQLEHVRGGYHGEDLNVHGILRLDSVSLLGQQVTDLETPFHVEHNQAQLSSLQGKLLGGTILGRCDVSLDATPRYAASLAVEGADLRRYAETVAGRQSFRGLVNGRLDLNGLGNDVHTVQGKGEAHVVQGDIGELPFLIRLINPLKLSIATRTAFDSADIGITIRNGESVLDPIKLTGNAISLQGQGRMGVQGDLDLWLKLIYGRDRVHLPLLSDAMREAGGQLFVLRIQGPIAHPRARLLPLPRATGAFRDVFSTIGSRRSSRSEPEVR